MNELKTEQWMNGLKTEQLINEQKKTELWMIVLQKPESNKRYKTK